MVSRSLLPTLSVGTVLVFAGIHFASQPPASLTVAPALVAQQAPAVALPTFRLCNPSGSNNEVPADRRLKLNAANAGRDIRNFQILAERLAGLQNDNDGRLELKADGRVIATNSQVRGAGATFNWDNVDLGPIANRGETTLTLGWTAFQRNEIQSETQLRVNLDTRGPRLDTVRLTGQPDFGQTLVLTFDDDDLNPASMNPATIAIHLMGASGPVNEADNLVKAGNFTIERGQTVRIVLGRLQVGTYRVLVRGEGGTVVTDLSGNPAGDGRNQERLFSSGPAPETGPRVEFPEFLPTIRQPEPERRPNPGDRVETRVARLYYFRDAHRVSQIINRITQSYNRAAVTQAQRRAEDARLTAEQLTDERRAKERAAVEAAQATRRIEQQLQAAHQELQRLQLVEIAASKIDDRKGTINTGQMKDAVLSGVKVAKARVQSPGEGGPVQDEVNVQGQISAGTILSGNVQGPITNSTFNGTPTEGFVKSSKAVGGSISTGFASGKITAGIRENNEIVGTFEGDISGVTISGAALQEVVLTPSSGEDTTGIRERIQAITRQIPDLQQAINSHRTVELAAAEAAQQLQSREDRAIAEQFRQEVAAAHEDPDTYAPATKDSVDPVAQVSISVIGEGLLHLRGPIRGINTIRRMINQIDTPVGQVRVQIHTVQINGERGDQMERVAGRVEGYVDLGRFLTNQSLLLLRRAVVQEAAQVALIAGVEGHYQVDRDRRYLYAFFGRDFIDELYEMDSEFLRSENKLLSLHSMDTISLNQALFIMALARNDVRERIVQRFMHLVQSELPQAEWDFRRSSELYPHKTRTHLPFTNRRRIEQNTMERVFLNAQQRYHFRNVRSFFENDSNWCGADIQLASFDGGMTDPNTMNSMQRTFLRLAQIFKSQMIAEVELKQRVIERALIEDERESSFLEEDQQRQALRTQVLATRQRAQTFKLNVTTELLNANVWLSRDISRLRKLAANAVEEAKLRFVSDNSKMQRETGEIILISDQDERARAFTRRLGEIIEELDPFLNTYRTQVAAKFPQPYATDVVQKLNAWIGRLNHDKERPESDFTNLLNSDNRFDSGKLVKYFEEQFRQLETILFEAESETGRAWDEIEEHARDFDRAVGFSQEWTDQKWREILQKHAAFYALLSKSFPNPDSPNAPDPRNEIVSRFNHVWSRVEEYENSRRKLAYLDALTQSTRQPLSHSKLLDFLIDEREEKHIELLEGTRSYIAAVDQYLKRLSTALEDDFKVQFYDPAFTLVRAAAREHSVTLGQVERTTLLMNNRAIAIVKPSATMEFDLPKRDIVIVEALEGAKALAQDYGALLNDPTFLAAFQLMGGAKQPGVIKNLYPSLGTTTDEHLMGLTSPEAQQNASALQSLVPEPAIYKFETGTGFEIRPVIQPDGDSVVYDFNYMYTTNVREPVRADEKHLGRIKRHFIDTQVQTSSFELREISRYQVALKAARTSRGVPLLEDIPGVGVLFRPLPSAESSLQQNIILGQSTVYPTLFDLMGLRWARHVVDLDHLALRDTEHVVRGRNMSIEDYVFDQASARVDEFMDISKGKSHYRPDLYRPQRQPSPYHPRGYIFGLDKVEDPTGEDFRVRDSRPLDMQMEPPYDDRFRRPHQLNQLQLNQPQSSTMRPTPASPPVMQGPTIQGPIDESACNSPLRPRAKINYRITHRSTGRIL